MDRKTNFDKIVQDRATRLGITPEQVLNEGKIDLSRVYCSPGKYAGGYAIELWQYLFTHHYFVNGDLRQMNSFLVDLKIFEEWFNTILNSQSCKLLDTRWWYCDGWFTRFSLTQEDSEAIKIIYDQGNNCIHIKKFEDFE